MTCYVIKFITIEIKTIILSLPKAVLKYKKKVQLKCLRDDSLSLLWKFFRHFVILYTIQDVNFIMKVQLKKHVPLAGFQ